jgi:membrane protein DedA with SNARE-associated domain
MEARGWVGREQRIEAAYQRWGLAALFLGRLVPGVRGVVALFAGAFRINAFLAVLVMTAASAIWYGILVWIASRVGANWELFVDQLSVFGRWGGGVALALALVGGGLAWRILRKRKTID